MNNLTYFNYSYTCMYKYNYTYMCKSIFSETLTNTGEHKIKSFTIE